MTVSQISSVIFQLAGGLGLFLFGMKLMSGGLEKTAGNSLKIILEKLTSNRIIGTIVGAAVTTIIQSSSATTVMVVGFVNAGLMSLTQALSVILGANVGTTITAQIIAFKITAISMPAIGIGVIMIIFIKKPMVKDIGEIILGFGLLFCGMDIMTNAFIPLSKSQGFTEIFIYFAKAPILAVAVGAITTLIIQSSSATIGITIALATTGILNFPTAAALVLGENIGTTITANIAALSAGKTAKQAALGHFLFNFIGVFYMMIFLTPLLGLINLITPGDVAYMANDGSYPYMARHIANIHTMFNIINTIIFLPFLPLLAKLCEKIIKPEETQKGVQKIVHLSDALISTPEIAAGVVRKEVCRMFSLSLDILDKAKNALLLKDDASLILGRNLGNDLEYFNDEISKFLEKLSMKQLSEKSEILIRNMAHSLGEIKQIGDRAEKLIKISRKLNDNKIIFTGHADEELKDIFANVINFTNKVFDYYKTERSVWKEAEQEEDVIDKQRKTFKKNHLKRLAAGTCTIEAGMMFVDILNTLEKIGDDAYSITQALPVVKVKQNASVS